MATAAPRGGKRRAATHNHRSTARGPASALRGATREPAAGRGRAAPRLCGIALMAALLSACGGGDGDSAPDVPRDTVRLDCKVSDQASGNAVAGAGVNYQSGSTEYATTTDAAGRCTLDLPATEVAGVAFPAASVEKPGYEPQTLLCSKLQGGSTCAGNVHLVPLADNVSIPVGGGIVMHLGDDLFEGAVNSQFQKKTDGAELAFVIEDWAAKSRAGYTKATVYLDAKGWQSSQCENRVALSGDVGTVTMRGGDSPTGGHWAGGKQVPFVFAVARVGAQRAEVRIIAGACGGTTDLDDFEINRLRVYFS
jgi:hypothetical protein